MRCATVLGPETSDHFELAERAPSVLEGARGKNALKFALEIVLMGRAHPEDDEQTQCDSDGEETGSGQETEVELQGSRGRKYTPTSKKSGDMKNLSPAAHGNILEDEGLSLACRRLCAAMEFLVSYIRSSILLCRDPTLSRVEGGIPWSRNI